MPRITEKIVEPSKIFIGSIFKLRIKAITYLNYDEVKNNFTYLGLKNNNYSYLKGEEYGNNN